MASFIRLLTGVALLGTLSGAAEAQHLIWLPPAGLRQVTCLYGEIQVLATGPTIYYCGCNWWPGNPAGGYTGIQDAGDGRHLMIFSIWDTSPALHPTVTAADGRTVHNRFGGEGEGAHTHLDYDWKLGETYRYYATKKQDKAGDNTLTALYFYDARRKRWVHEATLSSPNGGHDSVKTFGGMLNAFLENWSGQDSGRPKLALYRLWVGDSPARMTSVTEARGDGNWGILNDTFYLAEGDADALEPVFERSRKTRAALVRGAGDRIPLHVRRRRMPAGVVRALKRLPISPPVR